MRQHLYERIARDLGARITSGKVSVGDALPTEAALCTKYGVSRYTAREALRQLRDAGLITRRRRAGTIVASAGAHTGFSLPFGSAEDLFRYASVTRFVIERRSRVRAAGEDLATLGCRRGQRWIKLEGIRLRPGAATPVCLITVYLHEALGGLRIARESGALYPQVEQALGVRITWIGHRIEAVPLTEGQAERLRARPGSCGLRVRRYYYDARERLLEVSDSLHAAERFAYEMRLRRD